MPQFIRLFLNKFKEYVVLAVLLVLSLILITLNDNSKVKNVRLYTLGFFATISSTISDVGSLFEDTAYIESLEKNNAELMLQINQLRNYGLENSELKDLLSFKEESKYNFVTAKIVSRLVSKISGYFIISKGLEDGIEEGFPVITDKGLVGIIVDVADGYSSVRTFENSLFKVAVKNQRSNVDGILNWDGKNLVIKNVPTTHDIEVGDRIIISEISSILPPSIPVGIVSGMESTLSGVLSNLRIKPFVELGKLKNVIVLQIEKSSQLDSLATNLHRGLE